MTGPAPRAGDRAADRADRADRAGALRLRFPGLDLDVHGADADLAWLEEFLVPAFERRAGGAAHHDAGSIAARHDAGRVTVVVRIDPARHRDRRARGPAGGDVVCFEMDAGALRLPLWHDDPGWRTVRGDDDILLRVSPARRRVELLADRPGFGVRLLLLRTVRELACRAAVADGGALLHAAAFDLDGQAILLAGPKRAGKSSVLLFALRQAGGAYIGNDRVLLRPDGRSGVLARGVPTIISLREGSLALFSGVRDQLRRRAFHSFITLDEARDRETSPPPEPTDGRFGITPAQLCALAGCAATGEAPATALLFPTVRDDPGPLRLEALDTREATRLAAAARFGSTSQGTIPADPAALLARVPAFRCCVGPESFGLPESVTALRGLRRGSGVAGSVEEALGRHPGGPS